MVVKFEVERGNELGAKKTYKKKMTLDTKKLLMWTSIFKSEDDMHKTLMYVPNCITIVVYFMCRNLNGQSWWMKWGNVDQYEWTLGGEVVNKNLLQVWVHLGKNGVMFMLL